MSEADRLRVLMVSQAFVPDPEQSLFGYLADPLLAGKSTEDIRAEADLLMIRLIATRRAQQLAGQLQRGVQWHGSDTSAASSRSALVWAALILSLDPTPGARPATFTAWTGRPATFGPNRWPSCVGNWRAACDSALAPPPSPLI
ncbi:hypothetical protein JWR97_11915 [Pseudomonas cedrina subsp. fulgida]|nr:hypothetical protein [Pseudomonas cedrina subsp. fulgida]